MAVVECVKKRAEKEAGIKGIVFAGSSEFGRLRLGAK